MKKHPLVLPPLCLVMWLFLPQGAAALPSIISSVGGDWARGHRSLSRLAFLLGHWDVPCETESCKDPGLK